MTPEEALKRYWGYDSFRPMQREIIESVLEGRDTLGLLPTGGGKSLTFQVPAMVLGGLTIVVTPLISLMKDQVDNLRRVGIRAVCIHSGMTRAEQQLSYDHAYNDRARLMYLSPERLQNEGFISQLRHLPVRLIVVDEAHCISQWGYDFRPSYLKIREIRYVFPDIPVLALTASATPEVVSDIQKQLAFRANNVLQRSFARPNISYLVRRTADRASTLLRVLSSTTGSAIVYTRSRTRTRELTNMLNDAGISAAYYHAGLDHAVKSERQSAWKDGTVRVMVATNAFGMGIDKPDVRVVCHVDIPSSLEEYYQEAGRAGRDGLPAYAVLIIMMRDNATLTKRLAEAFPEPDFIRRVYELAGNFLNIPVGGGYNHLYDFNFALFCHTYKLPERAAHSALDILTRAGYIDFQEDAHQGARVMIACERHEFYDLRLDQDSDRVLEKILRYCPGIFADYVPINENVIASRLNISTERVYQALLRLQRHRALHYIPRRETPYIFYTLSRRLPKHIILPLSVYEEQRARLKQRLDAMRQYAFTDSTEECRTNIMLAYFGDLQTKPCGTCDYCRAQRRRPPVPPADLDERILYLASHPGGTNIDILVRNLALPADILADAARRLVDTGRLALSPTGRLIPTGMK